MPMTVYGTQTNPVELTMENVSVKMRQDASCAELIRACNYKKIQLVDMDIDGFEGECLIRSRSEGKTELENVTCSNELKCEILYTDEDFKLGWM